MKGVDAWAQITMPTPEEREFQMYKNSLMAANPGMTEQQAKQVFMRLKFNAMPQYNLANQPISDPLQMAAQMAMGKTAAQNPLAAAGGTPQSAPVQSPGGFQFTSYGPNAYKLGQLQNTTVGDVGEFFGAQYPPGTAIGDQEAAHADESNFQGYLKTAVPQSEIAGSRYSGKYLIDQMGTDLPKWGAGLHTDSPMSAALKYRAKYTLIQNNMQYLQADMQRMMSEVKSPATMAEYNKAAANYARLQDIGNSLRTRIGQLLEASPGWQAGGPNSQALTTSGGP
jgi:hypothetical protein